MLDAILIGDGHSYLTRVMPLNDPVTFAGIDKNQDLFRQRHKQVGNPFLLPRTGIIWVNLRNYAFFIRRGVQHHLGFVGSKIERQGRRPGRLGLQPYASERLATNGPIVINPATGAWRAVGTGGVFWFVEFADGEQSAAHGA